VSEKRSGKENTGIKSEIEELRALRRQLQIWRPSLVVVLAVVILVSILMLWHGINGLVRQGERQNQFVQQLGERMQKDVLPLAQDVGKEAISGIDFNKEIDKLNARAPEVANAGFKEMRLLGTDNLAIGKKVLNEQFDAALNGRAAMLKQEFPEASEDQIASFLTDFTAETKTQITEYVNTLFTPHITAMNDMMNDLKSIEVAEGPANTADMPTWEMAFLIADIARADFETLNSNQKAGVQPSVAKTGKENKQ
jgi:hypothetical protein